MDISPGIEAMMLMAPMAEEGYRPLYQLNEFYQTKDLEGIFHAPVEVEQIKTTVLVISSMFSTRQDVAKSFRRSAPTLC